jgi:hypothetical protein
MANATGKPRQGGKQVTRPAPGWTDPIVRWLRTNSVVVNVYGWTSRSVVPMLFALFVAAPIGLLMLPLFIPKFIRNWNRRIKYGVELRTDPLERIKGTHPRSKGSS